MKIASRLIVLGLFVLVLLPGRFVSAQEGPGNDWSNPTNLSQSGSATAPALTLDSNGKYQIVWQDEFAGPIQISGDATGWSPPSPFDLPLADSIPTLLADPSGNIHIFWTGSDNGLYYSQASAADFAQTATAGSMVKLSESVLNFDAALDSDGNLHLSYIQSMDSFDSKAGVYYRFLETASGGWSFLQSLYLSPYFRSIESDASNIDIATSTAEEAVQVYVAWDNRSRERVFLAKSLDGGDTWSEAEEIDKTDQALESGSPLDIQVSASDGEIVLVWQRANPSGSCTFQYQWSGDSGSTWTEPRQMLEPSPLCGQDNQLLGNENGFTLLWTLPQSQVALVAWDWDRKTWSDPQIQYELSAFNDPETSNLVTFGCLQPHLSQNNQLAVVGCDTGTGGDIWFTSRRISNIADWYPTSAGWSEPVELVTNPVEMISPVIVSGPGQLQHVLWSQARGSGGEQNRTAIYYIGGDGEVWTQPAEVIQSSSGSAGQPSATIDAQGRLLVAWSSVDEGKIFFSWANSARANNGSEWSDPVLISQPESIARNPNILVSESGTIYVIYAVPVNEGRGLYLTSSNDEGASWTQPVQVFDGVKAGWQMVDQPQIAETPDGSLHALWIHAPQPGGNNTLGLYYSRSADGGETWSEAEEVTNSNVIWSQITSAELGSVYRNWQEEINGEPVIRYQHLLEGGIEWSAPQGLSSFGESLQNAKLVLDSSETLHLLQIVRGTTGRYTLRHWEWEDERWAVSENVELGYEPNSKIYAMAASASPERKLDLVYFTLKDTDFNNQPRYGLSFLDRPLEMAVDLLTQQPSTPVPTALSTPTALLTLEPTTELQPTSTPDVSALNLAGPTSSGGGITNSLIIGVTLSGFIVAAVIVFRFFKTRFVS